MSDVSRPLTGRDRGFARGQLRRNEIGLCIDDWLTGLRWAGVANPRDYLSGFYHATDFIRAIRELTPDLLEEVEGLAVGSNQPFDLLMTAQWMDEEWAYRSSLGVTNRQPEKCSSVAVRSADGAVIVGQNMDLPRYTAAHQVFLQIEPSVQTCGAMLFSIHSMIGLMGVNTRGVAVCVNALPQLPANRSGLPVSFVLRRLLSCRNLDEACRTVSTLPHATGQHYLIADSSGFRSFEASPAGVIEHVPREDGALFHTNHPLAEPAVAPSGRIENSRARLNALVARLGKRRELNDVKGALASRDDPKNPVSREGAQSESPQDSDQIVTVGSLICVLRQNPSSIELWLSPGPPGVHGYAPLALERQG